MRVAPLALLVLLALTGCSYGASPAPTSSRPFAPENTSAPPMPESWLAQVCGALVPAVRTTGAPPETDRADLPRSQALMLTYLEDRVTALNTAADRINAAGPAPVDNGQSASATVVDLLRQRAETLSRQRDSLAAVPANSEGTLTNELQQVRTDAAVTRPATLRDLAVPASLTEASTRVPECEGLG